MGPTTTDRAAFDQTILPLQPGLMHLALGLTRDAGEARDLVQDAFERALRDWTRFTPGTNARAWLSAILSRLFIDRWRRRQRQPRFVDIDGTELAGARWPVALGGEGALDGAQEPSWAGVTESDLCAAIRGLPPKLRRVFELSAAEQRTYVEISRLVGIPVNTVGTRLLRARRQVRDMLERAMRARDEAPRVGWGRMHTLVPAPRAEWVPVVRAGKVIAKKVASRTNAAPLSPALSPLRGARGFLDVRPA